MGKQNKISSREVPLQGRRSEEREEERQKDGVAAWQNPPYDNENESGIGSLLHTCPEGANRGPHDPQNP